MDNPFKDVRSQQLQSLLAQTLHDYIAVIGFCIPDESRQYYDTLVADESHPE